MTDLTQTFAALSDPTRLSMVEKLMADGELPAGERNRRRGSRDQEQKKKKKKKKKK